MADKKVFNAITPPFDQIRDDLADLGTKNHSDLDQLIWSTAGHTIDTNVDLATNDLLNVGVVNINSTIDHTITDSSDTLVITNPNEDGDINFNVLVGGTTHDFVRIENGTFPQLVVGPTDGSITYTATGLIKLTGTIVASGIGVGMDFNLTVSGAPFIGLFVNPTMNSDRVVEAFRLLPTWGAYDRDLQMFNLGVPAHVIDYNDTYKFFNTSAGNPSRAFVAVNTPGSDQSDTASVTYNWLELGATCALTELVFGGDPISDMVDFTENMIILTGGAQRQIGGTAIGGHGSINQVGLTFNGFGETDTLIAGDSSYAIYADGGVFAFEFDYEVIPTAVTKGVILMGAGQDMGIGYDGTDGIIDTSLVAASDLLIDCGTNKTVELQEVVWDDQQINLNAVRLHPTQTPTWTDYHGSQVLAFSDTTDHTIYFSAQLTHKYKEGEDIEFHIHYAIETDGAGAGAENVAWSFTHAWSDIDAAIPNATTVAVAYDVQNKVDDTHYLGEIAGTITGTSKNISSLLLCSLTRDVSEDSYGADVYLLAADFHVPLDTMGSRQEGVK